jgi:hypothetical protein
MAWLVQSIITFRIVGGCYRRCVDKISSITILLLSSIPCHWIGTMGRCQNFLSPGFKLYCVIKYAHIFILSSDSVMSSASILCTVLSTFGSKCMIDDVVACILSSLVIPAYCLASNTLLCIPTSPSCTKFILGARDLVQCAIGTLRATGLVDAQPHSCKIVKDHNRSR